MTGPSLIATLVLAAGASSRMGFPKQLLRLDGRSLLRRAAESALALKAGPVLVVLGAGADALEPELSGLPLRLVRNHDWREGLGASVRAGVAAIDRLPGPVRGLLVTLADQPRVDADTLARIVDEFRRADAEPSGAASIAVAAGYPSGPGVPALFGSAWLPRLRTLTGDRGAGPLLRADPDAVRVLPLPEAADDVDTPADLQRVGIPLPQEHMAGAGGDTQSTHYSRSRRHDRFAIHGSTGTLGRPRRRPDRRQ